MVFSFLKSLHRSQPAALPPSTLCRLPAEKMMAEVAQKVIATSSVLDIGPGLRPMQFFTPDTHIFLEGFAPYLEMLQQRYGHEPGRVFLHARAEKALPMMPDRSVDSIMMIDVIEHLPKARALKVLRHCERIARRQIVIGTPYGFVPQEYEHEELDGWNFAHNKLQTHRSGWTEKDFSHGWELLLCENFAQHQQHQASYGLLYAFRHLSPAAPRLCAPAVVVSGLVPPHNANPYSAFFAWLSSMPDSRLSVVTDKTLSPDANHDHISDLPAFSRHRLPFRYHGVQSLYQQSPAALAATLDQLTRDLHGVTLFFTAEHPALAMAAAEYCRAHDIAGVCIAWEGGDVLSLPPHTKIMKLTIAEDWTPERYQQALAAYTTV